MLAYAYSCGRTKAKTPFLSHGLGNKRPFVSIIVSYPFFSEHGLHALLLPLTFIKELKENYSKGHSPVSTLCFSKMSHMLLLTVASLSRVHLTGFNRIYIYPKLWCYRFYFGMERLTVSIPGHNNRYQSSSLPWRHLPSPATSCRGYFWGNVLCIVPVRNINICAAISMNHCLTDLLIWLLMESSWHEYDQSFFYCF